MDILTTGTEEWLRRAAGECRSRFLVAVPFVGRILPDILSALPSEARSTLLTRMNLKDFAAGSSDIDAVIALAERGTLVKSLHTLHAKVYVADSRWALVTSANATEGGLRRNRECGVVVDDPPQVDRLAGLIESGFGADGGPVVWSREELAALRKPVERVRELLGDVRADRNIDAVELRIPDERRKEDIVSSLGGWTALVLEGILEQDADEFSLDDLMRTCGSAAAARYPHNRHVRAKLRQQLQRLRDMGLVEFLGGGFYRRMIRTRSGIT